MPPFVATLFCLAFILVLLVRDLTKRDLGLAIWMPIVWLLIIGSRSWSQWFGLGNPVLAEDGLLEGSPLDRYFFFVVILGCFAVASSRGVKWTTVFANNAWIVLFYAFFAFSVFWAEEPLGAFKRLFKDFGLIFVASVVLTEQNPFEAIRAVYVRCAIILFPLSVLFIRYYPDLGRVYGRAGDQMFTGVTTQKNSLGEIVMVFSLFLVWEFLERRRAPDDQSRRRVSWDLGVLLVMGIWLLQMSESKTALVCLLIGSTLLLTHPRLASRTIRRFVFIGALCVPFFLLLTTQLAPIIQPLAEALGRDMTFTGRTDIWQQVLSGTYANPIVGAGFFNFWGSDGGDALRAALKTPFLASAHNGYLDMFLDGGLVGVSLVFLLLWTQSRRLLKVPVEDRYERLRFATLIVCIIYNLSESAFGRLVPTWYTTILVLLDHRSLHEMVMAPVAAAKARVTATAGRFAPARTRRLVAR